MAGVIPYGADTGTANSYISSISAITSLSAGVSALVSIAHSNTGASTLNVSSTGAKSVTLSNGAPVTPGALAAGQLVLFNYDGTNWQISEGLVSGFIGVEQFGALGNGSNDWTAMSSADTNHALVFSAGKTYTIGTTGTISSPAVFAPGAMISVSSGVTVTFKQPPIAGMAQIFTGAGAVLIDGEGYAEWFGAKGDGSTDDSGAINKALAACNVVQLLEKTYWIGTTTLTMSATPKVLRGLGPYTTQIQFSQSTQDAIYIDGWNAAGTDTNWFKITDLSIENKTTSPAPTAGAAIDIVWSSPGLIENVRIKNCWGGITGNTVADCLSRNVRILWNYGYGITVGAQVSGWDFEDVWVYGFTAAGSSTIRTQYGLALNNNAASAYIEGCEFLNLQIVGCQQCLYVNSNQFTSRKCVSFCMFTNCQFDTMGTNNYINYMRDSVFTNCWFSTSSIDGVALIQNDNIQFIGCQVYTNQHNGILVESSTTNFVWRTGYSKDNGLALANTYAGIYISAGTTDFIIDGGVFKNDANPNFSPPQAYGIYVASGASDRYVITNNLVSASGTGNYPNTVAAISDGGTGTHKNVSNNL